jgi:Transposase, Mutator family
MLSAQDRDFLRPLVQAVPQELRQVEMTEVLGAEKGERTPARLAYRRGTTAARWSAGSASWSCACCRTARADRAMCRLGEGAVGRWLRCARAISGRNGAAPHGP